ncbi:caspase family protein [Spirosoma pollinicola]|uniref:Peptidase C14 caspase domain-containing protein n=1 Tax=Spirosoma pollinicola TaxID=2057025 RepID=A0A2K8Z4S3_9BACT|nr:caspase family protein [Spirosoma pollinicola]AUD04872.1 hypothetical protein CWM47_25325 [Spirosoma pollinicola]
MMLQPDPTQPGLWTNPAWKPGDAGTFAVLIGISDYPYLKDGNAPQLAENNYGLGQLAVSALTAYRLFEWLRDQYLYAPGPGAPCQLAQCWLLLAPTQQERAVMKDEVLANTLVPTYINCRKALRAWYRSMAKIDDEAARHSRAVFFYSGHGLEVSHEEQILLPTDYLEPTGGSLNDAVNLGAARPALMELKVGNQFIFLDACRNDTPELRERIVQGDGVFDQGLAHMTNPDCNLMLMYATASGQQTFGPRSVDKGISLFGQALLSGLKAERNFALDRQQVPYSVQWSPLHQFVGTAYNDLLKQYKSPLKQRVKVTGEYDDSFAVVTHIRPDMLIPAVPLPQERDIFFGSSDDATDSAFDNEINAYEMAPNNEYFGPADDDPSSLVDEDDGPLFEIYALSGQRLWNPFSGESFALSAHDFFGRETVTAMWSNARLYRVGTNEPVNQPILFQKVARTPDRIGYQVSFTLNDKGLYWLELTDDRTSYALILPCITDGIRPLFVAEFIVEESAPGQPFIFSISGLQLSLSPDNEGTLQAAALLWEKYENYGAAKATEDMDVNFLNNLVYGKMRDPLSALIASIILFRLGRTDKLPREWLENLLNWFPEYADTPVLLNEYLFRLEKAAPNEAVYQQRTGDCLLTMHKRGLPVTGEVISYAIREAGALTEGVNKDNQPSESLSGTLAVLKNARQFFLPGGLFTAFSGNGDALHELRVNWHLTH